ncbi:hypothetical protein ACFVVP_30435 [Streptomyces sp. NPDC058128]|uniref:hypothetical protein n=1 Tax=Streptomyces sp. NPDC058128 TaxID=3346352 RepID=UPI0036EC9ACD
MPLLLYVGDPGAGAGNPDQHTSGRPTAHGSTPRTSDAARQAPGRPGGAPEPRAQAGGPEA